METLLYDEDIEIVLFRDFINDEILDVFIEPFGNHKENVIDLLKYECKSEDFEPDEYNQNKFIDVKFGKVTCIIAYESSIFTFTSKQKDVSDMSIDMNPGDIIYIFGKITKYYELDMSSYLQLYENEKQDNHININPYYDRRIVFWLDNDSDELPGYGNEEKIPEEELDNYAELSEIDNWRQKLSRSWIQSFELNDLTWASVEHYFQACKFKNINESFYFTFSLDSDSDISKDVELALEFASRYKDLKQGYFDHGLYKSPSNIIYAAQEAKFSQNYDLKQILILTKDARLREMFEYDEIQNELEKQLMNLREIMIEEEEY